MSVVHQDPPVVCLYGYSGNGKSTAVLRAFPNAGIVAPKGGVKPASFLGLELDADQIYRDVRLFDDIIQVAVPRAVAQGRDALIIDDLTYLADESAAAYRQHFGDEKDYMKPWRIFTERMQMLRSVSREAGIAVAFDAHLMPPSQDKRGNLLKGGPALPGEVAAQKFPVMCDLVARVVHDISASGIDPVTGDDYWPYLMEVEPNDPSYVMKDRDGLLRGKYLMNPGEALRMSGYNISRPRGMEWQEGVVAKVSGAIAQGETKGDIFADVNGWMLSNHLGQVDPPRALGIMRSVWFDIDSRVLLTRQRNKALTKFGIAQ